jgi:hypothetical protein
MKKTSTAIAPAPTVFRPTLGRRGPATGPNHNQLQLASARKAVSQHGVLRGARVLSTFRPLAPGDPDAVSGSQPLLNVVATDVNYAAGQNDGIIICQGVVTITLQTDFTIVGTPVEVIADSGNVAVHGPIHGGPVSILSGSFGLFSYSPLSGLYSAVTSTGGTGGASPAISVAIPTVVTSDNTLVEVTASAQLITIGTGIRSITVKDETGSNTPSIPVASQAGLFMEDPNNLGNIASTEVVMRQANGAVTWRINAAGTAYRVVSST